MARSDNYKRDSNGRFASGGGGGAALAKGKSGGGKRGSSTGGKVTAANNATTKRLQEKGLTGIGSRLKGRNESLYAGKEKTRKGRAQLWANAEHNQKFAAGTKQGPQFMKGGVKGTIGRKRKG
jgi:hypothetical protein